MFNVVLVAPEIPPNTGNVIRLCANTGCRLHLVEPLGFSLDDRLLRRAGLDYHEYAQVMRYQSWEELRETGCVVDEHCFAFSTRGRTGLAEARFRAGDWLVFGSESAGLAAPLLDAFEPQRRLRLPMLAGQRSLNLSNAVAVAVFEAWRQCGYAGAHAG